MRRSIVVIVVCIAAGVATAVELGGAASHRAAPATAHLAPPGPTGTPVAAPPAPARQAPAPALTAAQIRATATTWVAALWTRAPGQGPFAWLNEVATITSPDLLAQLRTARATLDEQQTISERVDIAGVYASAVDPATVTVTCVAHIHTTGGVTDQPCATTVTVEASEDGHPTVTAVQ